MAPPLTALQSDEKEAIVNALRFMEIRAQITKDYSNRHYYQSLQKKVAALV